MDVEVQNILLLSGLVFTCFVKFIMLFTFLEKTSSICILLQYYSSRGCKFGSTCIYRHYKDRDGTEPMRQVNYIAVIILFLLVISSNGKDIYLCFFSMLELHFQGRVIQGRNLI